MKQNFSTKRNLSLFATLILSFSLVGCGGSSSDSPTDGTGGTGGSSSDSPTDGTGGTGGTISWTTPVIKDNMDASTSGTIAVYDLSTETSTAVNSMDQYSGNWHFSYKKHRFYHTNSGTSGQGNSGVEVTGCRAHDYYADLYDQDGAPIQAEFEELTLANTTAKFESITEKDCTEFVADSAAQAGTFGTDWYEMQGHNISVPNDAKGWIIKSSDDTYTRITADSYTSGSGFTFKIENWNGSTWQAAVDSPAINYYAGTNAYLDLDTNTAGDDSSTQGWDLHFKNTNHLPEIILADGASIAYYYDNDSEDAFTYESVAQIDNPAAPTVGATIYQWYENDTAGAMRKPENIKSSTYLGGIQMIGFGSFLPSYTTYILKEGDVYHKIQVLGYKGTDGTNGSGNIVFRYSRGTKQ